MRDGRSVSAVHLFTEFYRVLSHVIGYKLGLLGFSRFDWV